MSPDHNLYSLVDNSLNIFKDREVFPVEYKKKKYWVKRGRPSGSNLLQHFAWKMLHFPLLTPAENQSVEESIVYETEKIKRMHSLGIPVPSLILIEKKFFVMEDVGSPLYILLKKNPHILPHIYTAIELLGALHRKKEYHGGAQLRNITMKDSGLFFIDFEEKFSSEVSLELLQIRDVFMFLLCLSKHNFEYDYYLLLEKYITASGNLDIKKELEKISNSLRPVKKLLKPKPIRNILDKDTLAFARLLDIISSEHLSTEKKAGG